MESADPLLDLDYLVFSSHKTATQSIRGTLEKNGFRALHCHALRGETTRLAPGSFAPLLERCHRRNGKRLDVITTFREPMERYVSSFFQWHGEGVVRKKMVPDRADTIISRLSVEDLQARLAEELDGRTLAGMSESMHEICSELGITTADLRYDPERGLGLVEMEHCRLFIFRFDVLVPRMAELLSLVTGRAIKPTTINQSASKWYAAKFASFKASLRLPRATIAQVYEDKRDLVSLVYPGEYDALLEGAIARYGGLGS